MACPDEACYGSLSKRGLNQSAWSRPAGAIAENGCLRWHSIKPTARSPYCAAKFKSHSSQVRAFRLRSTCCFFWQTSSPDRSRKRWYRVRSLSSGASISSAAGSSVSSGDTAIILRIAFALVQNEADEWEEGLSDTRRATDDVLETA
jgi:hypothetical protein